MFDLTSPLTHHLVTSSSPPCHLRHRHLHRDKCLCLTRPVGKISLPSTTLHFFDLGGQRDIRSIWPKYYDECHAVVFVLDACDQARLSETWEVFGKSHLSIPNLDSYMYSPPLHHAPIDMH